MTTQTTQRCQFLISEPGARGPARKQIFDSMDDVEVLDLSTQVVLKVKAGDVSPYRHTLLLDGIPFRILNILKSR